MERCPLCESFAVVEINKPCYWCGLSLVEIPDGRTVAVVPGWMMFDDAAGCARALQRLPAVAGGMVLDLSEVELLNSQSIAAIVMLNAAVKRDRFELIIAQMTPNVMEVFEVCRFHKVLRIADDVDSALKAFGAD